MTDQNPSHIKRTRDPLAADASVAVSRLAAKFDKRWGSKEKLQSRGVGCSQWNAAARCAATHPGDEPVERDGSSRTRLASTGADRTLEVNTGHGRRSLTK